MNYTARVEVHNPSYRLCGNRACESLGQTVIRRLILDSPQARPERLGNQTPMRPVRAVHIKFVNQFQHTRMRTEKPQDPRFGFMARGVRVCAEEFERDKAGGDGVLSEPDCGVGSETEFVHDAVAAAVNGGADVGGEVAAGLVGFQVFDAVAGVVVDAAVGGWGRYGGTWRGGHDADPARKEAEEDSWEGYAGCDHEGMSLRGKVKSRRLQTGLQTTAGSECRFTRRPKQKPSAAGILFLHECITNDLSAAAEKIVLLLCVAAVF